MSALSSVPDAALARLTGLAKLDPPAKAIARTIRQKLPPGPVKDALSGSWLGHTLHPVLTDVPIGTWTSAVLLDWLGGRDAAPAARRLIGLGVLAAVPTAASGLTEWADTEPAGGDVRRLGIIHASANVTALTCFGSSWVLRRRGGGRVLATLGLATLMSGGWLGGHLSLRLGVGVNELAFEEPPEDWTPAGLREEEIAEGEMRPATIDGVTVLVARQGGRLHAIADRCAHRAGPLHEGELGDGTVTCPYHGSVFRLEDGALCRGPSAYPQRAYDVRSSAGMLELRPRPA